jgi:hypothetical protein
MNDMNIYTLDLCNYFKFEFLQFWVKITNHNLTQEEMDIWFQFTFKMGIWVQMRENEPMMLL